MSIWWLLGEAEQLLVAMTTPCCTALETMTTTTTFAPDESSENDDDDSLSEFIPLNDILSYRATLIPLPVIEVLVTQDIQLLRNRKLNTKGHSMYGIPVDASSKIKARNLSKGKAKKITKEHDQYALTAGMILGIRECVGVFEGLYEADNDDVSSSTATGDGGNDNHHEQQHAAWLFRECERIQKYKFSAGLYSIGSSSSSQQQQQQPGVVVDKPLPNAYEFKAYAPIVFAKIRAAFGIDKRLFLHSICGKFNFIEFMSNAKSGQFFFFSHDGQYMIKTQSKEESKFLHKILPRYYDYLTRNPHSLLTHFYGMYRVNMPDTDQCVHFCIMRSVFNTCQEINQTWDLKGSTKGRRAKPTDAVKKDLDILQEGRKLYFGNAVKEAFMTQLRRDATFLARLGIMDYSLLLGVHHHDDDDDPQNSSGDDTAGTDSQKHDSADTHQQQQQEGMRRPSLLRSNTPYRRNYRMNQASSNDEQDKNASDVNLAESDDLSDDDDIDDDLSSIGGSSIDGGSSVGEYHEVLNSSVWSLPLFGSFSENDDASSKRDDTTSSQQNPSQNAIPNPFTSREDLGIMSLEGGDPRNKLAKEIYYCGVIDILQKYNTRKWGETVMRKAAGNAESEISCVDPEAYANRFVKFISALIE